MKRQAEHRLFIPFTKMDKQADGTLIVSGVASTESEDSDGEVVKAEAMRAALPDYMTFGAVREMHQPIAAGTAIDAKVTDDGVTELTAHIVDPVSVLKVETKVLKGFSIGGRITKRNAKNKAVIEGLSLTEISLVDRPANPDAMILLVKFGKDGRALAEDEGQLRKGMYEVSRLADLLCSFSYLAATVRSEDAYEGDGSAMGGRLGGVCKDLIACLKDMVDEETAELLGLGESDMAAMAAKAAGAANVPTLRELARKLEAIEKRATTPGGTVDNEELNKVTKDLADARAALTKAEGEKAELTTKLAAETTRATTEKARADKAEKDRDDLKDEAVKLVDSLKAKGHVRAVSKSADNGGGETDEQKREREAKADKDPVNLVKRAHQAPVTKTQ